MTCNACMYSITNLYSILSCEGYLTLCYCSIYHPIFTVFTCL